MNAHWPTHQDEEIQLPHIRQGLITVKAQNKIRCEFVDSTDDKLFCDEERPLRPTDRLAIDRSDVHEVRLELTEENNAMVNACIGGAIGIAAGAISNAVHRDSTPFDPIIGIPGAVIGGVGFRRAHFVHGRVIYKR